LSNTSGTKAPGAAAFIKPAISIPTGKHDGRQPRLWFTLVEDQLNRYNRRSLNHTKMAGTDSIPEGACSIKIPDHDLLRVIGRGSYGEVWLARNIMGSYRAVKIIRRSAFDTDSPFDREFAGIKKFEPISRTHSGFVDILQIGRNQEERCLYYVMEAADDIDLGQAIDPERYIPRTLGKALARVKRFSVEQCVQMGLALCQALDHLHRHGLVHRDIKPSNIVFVNGVPKLADIGLVTESNNAHSFVGTEGFIPPEGPGSEQADIFSLGKALYEIASGRDRLDFPALPAALSEFPDAEQFLELNECLIRACRLNPDQRYASAREMYEDLALLASGKSLRRLRVLERRWQNAKRNTAITAAVAAVATMIIWPLLRERQHADELRERQIGVRSANGINKLDQGDLSGALGEFSEIFQLEAGNKRRFLANQTRVASILASTPKLLQMFFLEGRVTTVAFSGDGKKLLSVSKYSSAQIHDVGSGEQLSFLRARSAALAAFSPDDQLAIVADEDGWASLWNPASGETERLVHPANVMCARFSPSGRLIATACKDGVVRIWDTASKKLLSAKPGHTATIRSVAFSPNEHLLVSTSADGMIRLWDVATGEAVGPIMRQPPWVGDAAFSPDSTTLVTAGHDGWARLWKVPSGEELPTLMKHDDVLTTVAFSPDGAVILTASNDSTVRLWNAKTGMPLSQNHVFRHSSGVLSASFDPDGRRIVSGCADGTVRIWDLADDALGPQLVKGTVNDSGTVAATLAPGHILLHNLNRGGATNQIPVAGEVRELALSANGVALAAIIVSPTSPSNVLRIWNPIATGAEKDIALAIDRVAALTFSPDGASLAVRTGPRNNSTRTRVFDALSGAEWPLPDTIESNAKIAFHPTKPRLAIGAGNSLAIFGQRQSTPICEISVGENVNHLAFSHDGAQLLVCQTDDAINPKSAVLFDAETGKPKGSEFWHRDGVVCGAFESGGSRLVTGGEDREALVWNIAAPRELLPPLLHRQQVLALTFSSDGRWIGSASSDAKVRIWDSETGFPLTPPLSCERNQSQFIFLPNALSFITAQTSTRAWLWKLPQTDMSPEDAVALGHLLNSDLRVSGQPDTRRTAETWARLKQKFPERFSSSPAQVARWHAKQYRSAQAQRDESAMAFHLARLHAIDPAREWRDEIATPQSSSLAKSSR
jgi:WD40 repeat protein